MVDVRAYLDRIGVAGTPSPDAAGLRALHRAHLLAVPFENLDIHLGRWIELEPAALERKVVQQRRGGFCYELNGAFSALLGALGFEVRLLEARVRKAAGAGFGPPFDHMLLRVRCPGEDGEWLADVGFGDSFLEPLRLEAGADQDDPAGRFRIDAIDGELELRRAAEGGRWDPEHRFGRHAHELASYRAMCRYHQTSPRSAFTQRRVCSLATPTGRITLRDDRLIVTDNGQRSERPIDGEAAWRRALGEHFGVRLPEGERPAGGARAG
jgi:N-hydroxyarylamine O-acetyltransferase